MTQPTSNLLFFYGTECTHCHEMEPLIERLEKETGLKVDKLESWHDEENAKLLAEYDHSLCGGVPFMYNTQSQKFICGNCEYEVLKSWAEGK